MIVKNVILFITLFILFNYSNCQLITFLNVLNNRRLNDFYKCITEKTVIGNEALQIIKSLKSLNEEDLSDAMNKIRELLTNNYDSIKNCLEKGNIPKLPDGTNIINMNKVYSDKYDWTQFSKCLMNKVDIQNIRQSPLNNLINNINDGKYYNALREEFKLRNNGNSILRECIPYKNKILFNITGNNNNNYKSQTVKTININKYKARFQAPKAKKNKLKIVQ